jgi:hypothetical protein
LSEPDGAPRQGATRAIASRAALNAPGARASVLATGVG